HTTEHIEHSTLSLHDALPISHCVAPPNRVPSGDEVIVPMLSKGAVMTNYMRPFASLSLAVVLTAVVGAQAAAQKPASPVTGNPADRKSTRLNSRHVSSSYAVF